MVDFADVDVAALHVASTTTPTVAEGTLRLTMVLSLAVELFAVVLVVPSGAAIAAIIFFDSFCFDE